MSPYELTQINPAPWAEALTGRSVTGVTVKFSCGGREATAQGAPLGREFMSINGKGYGFGHHRYSTPQDVAPEGWVAIDPYTGCCYCPDCWKWIEEG